MTFDIFLSTDTLPARIPISYAYCLSAAIYKMLALAEKSLINKQYYGR